MANFVLSSKSKIPDLPKYVSIGDASIQDLNEWYVKNASELLKIPETNITYFPDCFKGTKLYVEKLTKYLPSDPYVTYPFLFKLWDEIKSKSNGRFKFTFKSDDSKSKSSHHRDRHKSKSKHHKHSKKNSSRKHKKRDYSNSSDSYSGSDYSDYSDYSNYNYSDNSYSSDYDRKRRSSRASVEPSYKENLDSRPMEFESDDPGPNQKEEEMVFESDDDANLSPNNINSQYNY